VRKLVDENGNLTLTRSYDPFGLVLQETGSGEALFGFGGGDNFVFETAEPRRNAVNDPLLADQLLHGRS
jgi:hypothetical protein